MVHGLPSEDHERPVRPQKVVYSWHAALYFMIKVLGGLWKIDSVWTEMSMLDISMIQTAQRSDRFLYPGKCSGSHWFTSPAIHFNSLSAQADPVRWFLWLPHAIYMLVFLEFRFTFDWRQLSKNIKAWPVEFPQQKCFLIPDFLPLKMYTPFIFQNSLF